MKKKIINLDPSGLISLHFFFDGLLFPVVAGSYNETEEYQLTCLKENMITTQFKTEDLCRWCQCHKINYQIIYPINLSEIYKNPIKYLIFLKIKKQYNLSN